MSAPDQPATRLGKVEMYGPAGVLRLDARDWGAVILTAFDYGWDPSGQRSRIFQEAALAIAGPEDREIALRLATTDRNRMRRAWADRVPGTVCPVVNDRDAQGLVDALADAVRDAGSDLSQLGGSVPCYRLLMRDFRGRCIEWQAPNRLEIIHSVIAFAENGRFEIWKTPLDLMQ